jgi:hypothetical protein
MAAVAPASGDLWTPPVQGCCWSNELRCVNLSGLSLERLAPGHDGSRTPSPHKSRGLVGRPQIQVPKAWSEPLRHQIGRPSVLRSRHPIGLAARHQDPGDPGRLVGQRDRGTVEPAAIPKRFEPLAPPIGLAGEMHEHGAGTLDELLAQVAVALATDTQELGLATARVLSRHQPDPGRKIPTANGTGVRRQHWQPEPWRRSVRPQAARQAGERAHSAGRARRRVDRGWQADPRGRGVGPRGCGTARSPRGSARPTGHRGRWSPPVGTASALAARRCRTPAADRGCG